MKNNEQLLSTIGEINDKYISEKNIKKKASPLKWAAAGSAACAAAIAGFIVLRNTGFIFSGGEDSAKNKWADCRIFPVTDYSSGIVKEGTQEIYCDLSRYSMYSRVNEQNYTQADEIKTVLDPNNPWNEDTELNTLPVFENLSYSGDMETATRYFTDETMLTMAENAAKQLGTEILESSFGEVGDSSQGLQSRYVLKAVCGGEKYGIGALAINVYSDGTVEIDFNDYTLKETSEYFTLPDEYSFDSLADDGENNSTLEYLAETFADLLQFEDYGYVNYISCQYAHQDDDGNYSGDFTGTNVYRIYEKTDKDARNIVNYNLAFADFWGSGSRLFRITLMNRISVSEYMGEYSVIPLDTARERLLKGAYVTNVYENEMTAEEVRDEDIASAELVYRFDGSKYFLPFYRFYVNLKEPPFLEGTGLNLYGAFYVPAISFEYVDFGFIVPDLNNEIIPAYPEELVSLPDGTEISKSETFKAYGTAENPILEFAFGFMRYGEPIFDNTIDDADCFDFDTMTFNNDNTENEGLTYFKVKEGDVLDNGLTVTKARYRVTWEDGQRYVSNIVEFNTDTGYNTYEGILRYFPEDDYMISAGDLYFYPDPSGSVRVPLLFTDSYSEGEPISFVDGDTALRTDGGVICVGNVNDRRDSLNTEEIFKEKNCVKVRLDLKYIVFADYASESSEAEAIFVGCELLD